MSAERTIPVLEVFGPTVQGEGMVVGRKTMFVRTAGCDYRCAWCDSAFTWDGTAKDEIQLRSAAQIIASLDELAGDAYDHVTISGGNPALLPQLNRFIDALHERGKKVALETQGSRWQDWFTSIDDMTISPKPPSSGMETDWKKLDEIVSKLVEHESNFCLKVVVFDEADLAYAKVVHQRYSGVSFYVQAGNGNLTEQEPVRMLPYLLERYEWLINLTMADSELNAVYVLPQLHTWVWGNKKGV
ncbi:MAG: 7-carboxy-7-deazaguanine synthase QueE [Candidatus Pristimantibacillus lignocellulolyticus]|uniref:7-carboxy-7-deazaguanine synthase n=1 Tax=Candidatus Pristimantibacillus lignocellulolyticus TaxID=2994561 RepID=A0A9J6ZE66_9BACL|nr:MAG: 7-carboxy-7-deazaguanine synthase QueE [Candidatus Pristimantibacillus lignocellulolyticus]